MSETNTVSPLRHRMIEDTAARKLNPHTRRGHIYSCKRFACAPNRDLCCFADKKTGLLR